MDARKLPVADRLMLFAWGTVWPSRKFLGERDSIVWRAEKMQPAVS